MVCVSPATPGTEACDAARGAFRPQWREWPAPDYGANLVRAGTLANAAVCNICITSQLPVVCPGIGRNANGALEVPHDQFAVGGKNQVLPIMYNADIRRQLFVAQRHNR